MKIISTKYSNANAFGKFINAAPNSNSTSSILFISLPSCSFPDQKGRNYNLWTFSSPFLLSGWSYTFSHTRGHTYTNTYIREPLQENGRPSRSITFISEQKKRLEWLVHLFLLIQNGHEDDSGEKRIKGLKNGELVVLFLFISRFLFSSISLKEITIPIRKRYLRVRILDEWKKQALIDLPLVDSLFFPALKKNFATHGGGNATLMIRQEAD